MPDSLEAVVVLLLLVMPGVLVGIIERVAQPRRFASDTEWVLLCVLRSLLLLSASLLILYALTNLMPPLTIVANTVAKNWTDSWSIGQVLILACAAYVLAFSWGLLLCRSKRFSIHWIAQRVSQSGVTAFDSVWSSMIQTRLGRDQGMRQWMQLSLPGNMEVFGKLRHMSTYVDADKPIEVFMEPAYYVRNRKLVAMPTSQNLTAVGIYLRITDQMVSRMFYAPKDWQPNAGEIIDSVSCFGE